MSDQEQFLDVIDRDEAERRFQNALDLHPLGIESIPVTEALGRVLARDVIAKVDVPAFDRSSFDGYALQANATVGATELQPVELTLLSEHLDAGRVPQSMIASKEAVAISTGGMLPRGADAVLMIEHAEEIQGQLIVRRALASGFGVAFTGTDIALNETVLQAGTCLTSRETGVLAGIGESHIDVWRSPRVAIISTGNEIVAPGQPLPPASVFDSNGQVLVDAVRELGCIPQFLGIVHDDLRSLRSKIAEALATADVVLLSGGTSKGQGDLCYQAVRELNNPGIIVHGVALKPGKPICLAVTSGKPVVVLPGFPTSAIFTFHEFVAPVLRKLAGRVHSQRTTVSASLAVKVNSEIGRTEYVLVGLVQSHQALSAYPMGKGSGSITTFSRADGFITIPRLTEIVEAGSPVEVQLLGHHLELADLVIIGSHCLGLDFLLSQLAQRGIRSKVIYVGSSAGVAAAQRGECDIAGIHLFDEKSQTYNRAFLSPEIDLVQGYRRTQGIVYRADDSRFYNRTPQEVVAMTVLDPSVAMVNRNHGSGTRILIDRLLAGKRPTGYAIQPNNHTAVAAAILQQRADWGVTIEAVARRAQLGFLPIGDEEYDFAIPKSRREKPAVQAFLEILTTRVTRDRLVELGCILSTG